MKGYFIGWRHIDVPGTVDDICHQFFPDPAGLDACEVTLIFG
jgi:hypothetical protein